MNYDAIRINDYGVIGNCRSAALISKYGGIDWLCWPYFDSAPFFARLIQRGGSHWTIMPSKWLSVTHRYVPDTNILQIEFTTPTGRVRIKDYMPAMSEEERKRTLFAENEIIRVVEGVTGHCLMTMQYHPQDGYRSLFLKQSRFGIRTSCRGGLLNLRTTVPLTVEGPRATAEFNVSQGEIIYSSLTFSKFSAVCTPLGPALSKYEQSTEQFWKVWAADLNYLGEYRNLVVRSALALKLLNYSPSGAFIAAPTMSLPERIGGNLNWDYRYCWLRDASLTVRTWLKLGCRDEAKAFLAWLLHSTALTRPRLKNLYDAYGRFPRHETEDGNYSGFKRSKPVRFGNRAFHQRQLDVYGEVMDAAHQVFCTEQSMDRKTQFLLKDIADYVVHNWDQPDCGIWEYPEEIRHTHSLLMCWVCMDRLIKLQEMGLIKKLDLKKYKNTKGLVAQMIEFQSWNAQMESLSATPMGNTVDAATILMARYGFYPYEEPRMYLTYQRLCHELARGKGLFSRNRDYEEGAFLVCSFWVIEYLVRSGRFEEGKAMFDDILSQANTLGLWSEEIDPLSGEFLGNYPLAFSHLAFINAAIAIQEHRNGLACAGQKEGVRP